MPWHATIHADELKEGEARIIEVAGKSVGLFHENGGYHAVLNFCPHAGAPVCRGWVEAPTVCDGPGTPMRLDPTRRVLRCPWHHWEFDLQTGSPMAPIRQRLRVFPVEVRDGVLHVQV